MKRIFILIFAILLAGFAVLLYQQRSVDHWYGAFRIGDNTEISFISVGIDVFYDANSDGIPQGSEMVAPDGKVNIHLGPAAKSLHWRTFRWRLFLMQCHLTYHSCST